MLISMEGVQGTGKTTMAIALAYEEHLSTGQKVISNQHLNFPYTKFSLEWFLDHISDGELEDCILVLDEMYQIADARSSQSKLNKLFTYFVVQTRKRGVDLYLCTHHIDHVDLRLRRAIDIRGACRFMVQPCRKCKCKACGGTGKARGRGKVTAAVGGLGEAVCPECEGKGGTGWVGNQPCETCLGYGQLGKVRGSFLDRRVRRRYPLEIFANNYWHLFDSWDRIPMPAKALQGIDTMEVG